MSVFEFGVAGGAGLVRMQEYAALIEQQLGVQIEVYGFDTGEGLPSGSGDYRDHPDQWQAQDYKMDAQKLQARLQPRTRMVLGQIGQTLPAFVSGQYAPVGFVSCDVDLYSSTKDVLRLFTLPGARMQRRVFMYFDDLDFVFNHRFAGEWLAIDEFNRENERVKIDVWHGIRKERVFDSQPWLNKMFIAHDLRAIDSFVSRRPAAVDGCPLD